MEPYVTLKDIALHSFTTEYFSFLSAQRPSSTQAPRLKPCPQHPVIYRLSTDRCGFAHRHLPPQAPLRLLSE